PGRGGYASARAADRLVYEARTRAAEFFGAHDPARVIFTPGGTYSLNMAIKGFLRAGDHIIVCGRQHNAVVRPLETLDGAIGVSRFVWDGMGPVREKDVEPLLTPRTRAMIVNHASNVDGLLYPLEPLGVFCKKHRLALIVDVAQSAGLVALDMKRHHISLLCATGHKGLWGLAGMGLLALGGGVELDPLVEGGTGSFSDSGRMPDAYPDRLEPGSMNLAGIAALNAGLREVGEAGIDAIFARKMRLALIAYGGLKGIGGMRIYWPERPEHRIPVFSFAVERMDCAEIGTRLDAEYGIACRAGLHCATQAHEEIGSYPQGTVRFAPGWFNQEAEVELFLKAVAAIVAKR
ncbi:MAG: aminotransferase class V-fold PLP-dependent enzyme, partial [Nitrospinae bacterium]|nr:aminotransferase class V-fold PLP-dependent enzyme [Nitrospinota bacterium]